jgi:hypothetical protein
VTQTKKEMESGVKERRERNKDRKGIRELLKKANNTIVSATCNMAGTFCRSISHYLT